jgi:hypothetical protein
LGPSPVALIAVEGQDVPYRLSERGNRSN